MADPKERVASAITRAQADLVEALHRGYFTDQASVFDHASLADLAADVGLDREEVLAVLAGDEYSRAVDADEELARSFGITGVPFFVIDRRYGISGAQPAETMLQVLERVHSEAA